MTAFAILRTAKLKTAAQIIGAVGHNSRERETLNADPSRKNVVFKDIGRDPAIAVMGRIKAAGASPRADSVLAVEILCSASPEYFRPKRPEAAGTWEATRTKAWAEATDKWLRRQFGDRLLDSRLHLDEATPHVQAVVVPLTRDNRLCAKEVIGPLALRQMQTSYAKAVEPLGIIRGLEGSQAKHTAVKEYYRDVNAPVRLPPDPVPAPIPAPPLLLTAAARDEWAGAQNKKAQEAARHQAQKRAPALRQLVRKARERDGATQRAREARAEDARLEQIHKRRIEEMQQQAVQVTQKLTAERDAARSEVDKLRGVKLEAVLESAGLEPSNDGRWQSLGHNIKIHDGKWFDDGCESPASGKGSIDLAKHLLGCDFHEAVGWLRERCGSAAVESAVLEARREAARKEVEAAPTPVFIPPTPTAANHPGWPAVKRWLTEVRGLKDVLVERLRDLGWIRVQTPSPVRSISDLAFAGRSIDQMHNAVFMSRSFDEAGVRWVGGEVRGIGKKFAGMLPGSDRRGGGFQLAIGDAASHGRVVLVESALDAIAFTQLHARPGEAMLVVSTAGATGKHVMLAEWKRQGRRLQVAFDSDEAGDAASEKLIERWESLPGQGTIERLPPIKKDWNDDLRTRSQRLPNLAAIERPAPSSLSIGSTEPAGPGL